VRDLVEAFLVGVMVGGFGAWAITYSLLSRKDDPPPDDGGLWGVPDYPPPNLMYGIARPSRVPAPVKVDKPPPAPPR